MSLYLVTTPTLEVLSLADAIAHCRAPTDGSDDGVIEAAIRAAVGRVDGREGVLNRALMDQTWDLKLDWFPCCRWIRVPLPPLIEVVSVKYIDTDGVEQTFAAGSYHVSGIGRANGGFVSLRSNQSWPTVASQWPEPIAVRFRAGYVDASDSPPSGVVPEPIISATKLIVGHLYNNRETVVIGQTAVEVPQTAAWLLEKYVVYS